MNIFRSLSIILFSLTVIGAFLTQIVPLFTKNYLKSKITCSSLFLLTGISAASSFDEPTHYSTLIIAALFFGLLGDFWLDYKKHKYFFLGVSFFSIGHLIYLITFTFIREPSLTPYCKQIIIGFLVLCVAAVIEVISDKIRFPKGQRIMIAYSFLLMFSFIFAVARGVVSIIKGNSTFGICLVSAGGLFLLSDTFLAASLYGKPKFKCNDKLVLFTYFPAQALFALSILFQ